jgi:hypothetical protein
MYNHHDCVIAIESELKAIGKFTADTVVISLATSIRQAVCWNPEKLSANVF